MPKYKVNGKQLRNELQPDLIGGYKREAILEGLAEGLRRIELPFDISLKAYTVKLDGLINGDTYENSNARRSTRISAKQSWVNRIQNREFIWSMFESLIGFLESEQPDFTIKIQLNYIFNELLSSDVEWNHYQNVKEYTMQLLDLFDRVRAFPNLKEYRQTPFK